MRSSGLRHPWRYALTALALGPSFSLTLEWTVTHVAWLGVPEVRWFLVEQPETRVLSFTLTCACIAWFGRRLIATCSGATTWILSATSTCVGGGLFMLFFMLLQALVAGDPGGSRPGSLEVSGTLLAPLFGAFCAPLLLPVTLPLGWLALRLLRSAAGGPTEPSADRPLAAESGA